MEHVDPGDDSVIEGAKAFADDLIKTGVGEADALAAAVLLGSSVLSLDRVIDDEF